MFGALKTSMYERSHISRHPLRQAAFSGLKTALWLLGIMIPVSLAVCLLQHFGYLAVVAGWLQPVCRIVGLRGEAALVWVTAGTMNIYSGIAVIQSIPFTTREVTIIALMTLIAHSLIVETVVQRKTGSSGIGMLLLRLGAAMAGGLLLNLLLPPDETAATQAVAAESRPLGIVLQAWLYGTLTLSLKMICIIVTLNILQQFLQDYGLIDRMARGCAPLMRLMGLAPEASFLWIVANTIGLSYGASVILANRSSSTLSPKDTDLLNSHIAVCHSRLEDTPMFLAVHASLFWTTVPRILLAVAVVWLYRLAMRLFPSRYGHTGSAA